MSKKALLIIKIILFPIIFYVVCLVVAFFFRDDANAYTRILMHELHNQEKIDVLFCGASHVSHGLLPSVMDEKLGVSTFCTGTPSQAIAETYAIIQDATSFYDIKEVYLEMDFAVACSTPKNPKTSSSTSKYLATHYLKNPKVKFSHILESTKATYLLNEFLPIGRGKLIDLNPKIVFQNVKSKITGEYHKYIYKADDSEYKGKGCVFDSDFIENGTYSSKGESPIHVKNINENYKNIIRKIIKFCESENIKLIFYAQPNSDFYLCEKGNYDEYYSYIKNFLMSEGYDFYDFNLCKADFLTLEDCNFSDNNHFNGSGIVKFTNAFCDFYNSSDKKKFFYENYKGKICAQNSKILGLSLCEAADKKSMKIAPILNHGDVSKILYTVTANKNDKKKEVLFEKSANNVIIYPENSSGELEIHAYYDGVEHCHITTPFVSM